MADDDPSRRDILAGAGALAIVGLEAAFLSACTPGGSARSGRQSGPAAGTHKAVRLLSVPTVGDGGEWSQLLPAFSRQTGIDVKL